MKPNETQGSSEGRDDAVRNAGTVSVAEAAGCEPERPSEGERPPGRRRGGSTSDESTAKRAAIPACPSLTLGYSSQERGGEGTSSLVESSVPESAERGIESRQRREWKENPSFEELLSSAVFAIDWYESGGVIVWDTTVDPRMFWALAKVQREASDDNDRPQVMELAGRSALVHPRGLGTGRQSRMEFRLEWAGVTIGLSQRDNATRRHSNFYLKVSGTPCVVLGYEQVRIAIDEIIAALGGVLQDEWIRRLDLCLDVPGLAVQGDLQRAYEAGQFLTSFRKWRPYDGIGGKQGFSLYGGGACTLNVYDKLADSFERHDGVYQLAMRTHRWGGEVPAAATRIEYQLRSTWLRRFRECSSASAVFENLGMIVERLVRTDPRPLFVLTDRVPDRKNKHQQRCETLPLWAAIVQRLQTAVGEPRGTLTPLDRGQADLSQLYAMGAGAITSAAAKLGLALETPEDAALILRKLMKNAGKPEDDLGQRWERKARTQGTYDDLMSFPMEAA